MNQVMAEIEPVLLTPGELDPSALIPVIGRCLSSGADYVDVFLQHTVSESWMLEDSEVKQGLHNVSAGAAVHLVQGVRSGFAYTENIVLPAIENAASLASGMLQSGASQALVPIETAEYLSVYPHHQTVMQAADAQKIALLKAVDQYARTLDPHVIQVNAALSLNYEHMYLLNSVGVCAADVRPLIRLDVTVSLLDEHRREQGHSAIGGRYDLSEFLMTQPAKHLAFEAVRLAQHGLEARPAPAGLMPVVLGSGWPGILLHEAIGHGLEGDFNRRGSSAFSNKIGQRVATDHCTVVDDATLSCQRGSLAVDDEGVVGQETVLIEAGFLKGYILDRTNARLMGMQSTGNGRRESYAFPPLPRMTNTFLRNGNEAPEDIIASVEHGVYCTNFSGGQVDITSGKFVFSANEAFLIEGGKVTQPIKNLTLMGDGPSVLTQVSMIGNDWALDPGIGVCGKAGQSIPVGVGQPTIKIDEIVVGGTQIVSDERN